MKKQNEFYDNKKLTLQRLKVIDYLQKSNLNKKGHNIDKGAVLSFKFGELNGDNIAGTILSFKLKIKRFRRSERD